MNHYKPVIGLEIHVELKTQSKMFCQCQADYFGKKPNSQVCPVCLGLPGALPVPNKKAIEWTILLGKALNCKINKISKFDRKHYFYPDLPKGYQISQYDEPIAVQGLVKLKIKTEKSKIEEKRFRIRRVHLEEDTGKLVHLGKETLIDFNRSGVPLVEIVTEPDFENSNDVKQFLEELQVIIRYLDISDADMEKGTMRLEPNISVINYQLSVNKKKNLPNYKVEIKNINSFRFVKQAIECELKRQIELLEKGITPKQETRGFDAEKGITYSQRTKEEAQDYRYFPEPDIPPMEFSQQWIDSLKVPELPEEKLDRYIHQYKIKYQDAFIITRDKNLAEYFEQVNEKIRLSDKKLSLKVNNLSQAIANLIVNKKIATNLSINDFVKKAIALWQPKLIDEKLLDKIINRLVITHQKAVKDYQSGKENALMFLVGQVMKEIKQPVAGKLIIAKLKSQISKLKA